VLVSIEGLEPHYELIVDRVGTLDTLEIRVEMSENVFSDEVRVLQGLEKRITKDIKDYLGVTANVRLVEPKSLKRFEGKTQRVIDNREI
jgi:phenylacetate-CoA ligase